ncbi:restriction endonuclease subunit S [Acinetobacter baumannii]|uniref:restriction endonuclease subunit S n=1 Tax=Acinetobacter baumannii TaxID=470 RepID=UPI0038921F61
MSEWQSQNIGTLIRLITKGTTPNKAMGGFSESGINYIKSESISYDGRIDSSKFAFIDEKVHQELKRSQLQKDDILFSMAGAYLGKSAIVQEEHLPANTNQALAIIRLDQSKAYPKFINYFFRHPNVIDYVNNLSGQSAQPNINFEEIKSIEVGLPILPEQKAIATVLSSLDDKIDLLHRQNKTLEAMAETLLIQHVLPREDEQNDGLYLLGDYLETISVTHKFPNPQVIFLNTSDIYKGKVLTQELSDVKGLPGQAKKSIKKGDILFSEIRPANGRYALIDFDADNYVVSTKLMVLRAKQPKLIGLLYFYLTNKQVTDWLQVLAESRSGTFPQITFDQVADLELRLPQESQTWIILLNYWMIFC